MSQMVILAIIYVSASNVKNCKKDRQAKYLKIIIKQSYKTDTHKWHIRIVFISLLYEYQSILQVFVLSVTFISPLILHSFGKSAGVINK